ncbi:MAG TPA: hypothetical protein VFN30_01655 [Chitinophagaceae bacterium]|nr:hypothetical protein [Chitinophagaceae bacterium]
MSLFNTNKGKKDKKKGVQAVNSTAMTASKNKFNTKGNARNTRLTSGTQRGS